jgi:hypothetical protein
MKATTRDALWMAAVSGLMVGCQRAAEARTALAASDGLDRAERDKQSLPNDGTTVGDEGPDKNCCKGMNECKGMGNCKTDTHDCAGKNECKGKGGCRPAECP